MTARPVTDESGFTAGFGFGGNEHPEMRLYLTATRVTVSWQPSRPIPCGDHTGLTFCDPHYVVTTAGPTSTVVENGCLHLPILTVPYCRVRGDVAHIPELGSDVFPIGWNYLPVVGSEKPQILTGIRSSNLAGGNMWYPPVSEGADQSDFPVNGGKVDHWCPASRGFREELGLALPHDQFAEAVHPLTPLFTYQAKQSWVLGAVVRLDLMGFTQFDVQRAWAAAVDGDESSTLAAVPATRAFLEDLAPCLPWVRRLALDAVNALSEARVSRPTA